VVYGKFRVKTWVGNGCRIEPDDVLIHLFILFLRYTKRTQSIPITFCPPPSVAGSNETKPRRVKEVLDFTDKPL